MLGPCHWARWCRPSFCYDVSARFRNDFPDCKNYKQNNCAARLSKNNVRYHRISMFFNAVKTLFWILSWETLFTTGASSDILSWEFFKRNLSSGGTYFWRKIFLEAINHSDYSSLSTPPTNRPFCFCSPLKFFNFTFCTNSPSFNLNSTYLANRSFSWTFSSSIFGYLCGSKSTFKRFLLSCFQDWISENLPEGKVKTFSSKLRGAKLRNRKRDFELPIPDSFVYNFFERIKN